jgi:pimeloyl-ACP methyl ester carboxylesterase
VTALDLTSHGSSPRQYAPLTPQGAATAVATPIAGRRFALLIGHSFGASTAVAMVAMQPTPVERVVLEELPGPDGVD